MAGKATQRKLWLIVEGEIFGLANYFKGALYLAMGPSSTVLMYEGYDINAYTFYTRKQVKRSHIPRREYHRFEV
jgi:hypothetical protein